jgi:hypothetical protein
MKLSAYLAAFAVISLLGAGCLQQPAGNGDVAALNASLQLARAQIASLETEKATCTASLSQSGLDNQRLAQQLSDEQAALANSSANERGRLNAVLAALNESAQSNVSRNLFSTLQTQYSGVDQNACSYYLLAGGYSTGGSASIPLSCSLQLSDLVNTVKQLVYYGAGCSTDSVRDLVSGYLNASS